MFVHALYCYRYWLRAAMDIDVYKIDCEKKSHVNLSVLVYIIYLNDLSSSFDFDA